MTPMMPPRLVSTADSVRNCSRMRVLSRRRWPSSGRSRLVRSVTDTSMMFITPMPPTKQGDAGDPDQLAVGGLGHFLQLLCLLQHVLTAVVEVGIFRIHDLLLGQKVSRFLACCGHGVGVFHLDGHVLRFVKLERRRPDTCWGCTGSRQEVSA